MGRLGVATAALAVALIVGGIPITIPSGAQTGADESDPAVPFLLFETSASMAGHPLLDGGNGTEENPYRFEDLRVEPHFRGIVVQDSAAHVVFRNITIEGDPVTDSEAEELVDAPEDVHYPLAQAVPLHLDEDPRVIRGVQLESAINVRLENVVMENVHHGAWLDIASELDAARVDVTTDVFDEQPHDTTHLAGPVSVWMTETTGEAGFVARAGSTLRLDDVDVTLSGTGVEHRRGDNSTVTYATVGINAQSSTIEAEGFRLDRGSIGINAYKSDLALERSRITDTIGAVLIGNQTSQFAISNTTLLDNRAADLSIEEAQGTVRDSILNLVFATADKRFPRIDGARTTALRMTNVTTGPGEVLFYGGQLDGEVFQIDGLDATRKDQAARSCEIIGGATVTGAILQDCILDRGSALGVGGGQKSGIHRNLVVERSHVVGGTIEIASLSRWEIDENTTVLKDVVLDGTSIERTCCFLSDPPSAASLSREMIDLWMEDVTIRNAPTSLVFSWAWNVTMRDVAFEDSSVSFAMTHSPGSLNLDARNVTANGRPVITEGGHVSGGTWGGVLLSNDASNLTIDEGAEIGRFGVRTWGQEDLSIRNATIAGQTFPIQTYMVRDVTIADTTIVDGAAGLCFEGGHEIHLERVKMPGSGLAPGLCLDPAELTLEDVTAGGAPVITDPTGPVSGDVGQLILSQQDATVQDARFHGLPMGIIAEGANVSISNASADAGLVWSDRAQQLTLDASSTHQAPDRAAKVAKTGASDLWMTEFLFGGTPVSVRAEGVESVTVDGLNAQGTLNFDAVDDEEQREARVGSVALANLTLPDGALVVENFGDVELRHVRSGGDVSTFHQDQLTLQDVFLEDAELFTIRADNATVLDSTFEGRVNLDLTDPETRSGDPTLSFLVNATWEAANRTYEDVPKPQQLSAVFETIDQLRRMFLDDAPETFTELESMFKNCEGVFFYCPAGAFYEALVGVLFPPESTTLTNGQIHRSNLLSTVTGEGKINATDNWWGQPGGPREEQVQDPEFGTLEMTTTPAADAAFNEPPTLDVLLEGAPVANKTVLVHVETTDDNEDVEGVRVELGEQVLDGSGPVTLPGPGTLDWQGVAVDGFDARGEDSGTLTVLPEPTGTIETAPEQPRAGETLYASLHGTTEAYTIAWDLGADGSVEATGEDATFVPESAGTYPLEASFQHAGETIERLLTHVTVSEPGESPPEVSIDADPRTGQAPLEVQTSGQALDKDGFLETWTLRVDGEAVADGTPPFTGHTLVLDHGAHTVTLAYTDDDGLTGAASVPVSVATAPVAVADAALTLGGQTPETWIAGETPTLGVNVTDDDASRVHVEACVVGSRTDVCTTSTEPTGRAELVLAPLPLGEATVEIRAWDGQGTSASTELTLSTVENSPPVLDPEVPETVEAGEPVTLTANALDPEARDVAAAWLTPWGTEAGDAVQVTPDGWGPQVVRTTAEDALGLTTSRVRTVQVDAALELDGKALPAGPDGFVAAFRTAWLGGPNTAGTVEGTLSWNGLLLDHDQTRTTEDGIGTLNLEHPAVGLTSGPYTITLEAASPSPADDVDPGQETAQLTLEVGR